MAINVIVSGGVAHPFEATSAQLQDLLGEAGVTSTITDDVDAALAALPQTRPDLVTLNMLRWRMDVERYSHLRDEYAISLSEGARAGLSGYVREGGALLALHGATICFDDWDEWQDILGAAWDWDTSFHPPVDRIEVEVVDREHELVAGLETFVVVDEAYGFLSQEPDLRPLLATSHSGRSHPLLWERDVGRGRVVYDALGHDERSFAHPTHREILRRAARFLVEGGGPDAVQSGHEAHPGGMA